MISTAKTATKTAAPPKQAADCPTCAVPLVRERQASPWCERCGFGLKRFDPPPNATWWQRRTGGFAHRIAYRLTMAQYRRLTGGADPFHPAGAPFAPVRPPHRLSLARLAALAFSVVFYAFIAGLGYLGVRLAMLDFPGPGLVVGGLLILIAIYLLPRLHSRRRDGDTELTRAEAPTLFALVDRVSAGMGTRTPAVICVEPWFNASTTAVGLRRRRRLTLGLAMWGSLDPQQRVGVLAHEMGHFVGGDIRRGLLVAPAMTSLARMADLFTPPPQTPRPIRRGGGFAVIIQPLVDLLMKVIAAGFYLAHLAVLVVLLRDSQRREYLADQRAARLAGTAAMVGLFDLFASDADTAVVARARAQETEQGWRAATAAILAAESAGKRNRLRQLSLRHDASLWSTHPPSGLRAWLAESTPRQDPALVLSEEESGRIDAELERHYASARRALSWSRI